MVVTVWLHNKIMLWVCVQRASLFGNPELIFMCKVFGVIQASGLRFDELCDFYAGCGFKYCACVF